MDTENSVDTEGQQNTQGRTDLEGSAYRDRQQSEHTRLRRNRMFSRHRMCTNINKIRTLVSYKGSYKADVAYRKQNVSQ